MIEENTRIGFWSARFLSPALEREFQDATRDRSVRLNFAGVGVATFMFALYIFFDLQYFDDPTFAVATRLAVTIFSIGVLVWIALSPDKSSNHQWKFIAAIAAMGTGILAIILVHPNEYEKLYIALMQGAVLFGFVLRINFVRMAAIFGFSFLTYFVGALNMANRPEAMMRSVSLLIVVLICIVGVYLLQRYHRRDFLQSRVIDEQNRQLSRMLDDVRLDNERKLAAMNLLVHFVRTPIHQISGFTDVVLQQLRDEEMTAKPEEVVANAQYIKDASSSLTSNVTQLLDYHRLDEIERRDSPERVQLRDIFDDGCEKIDDDHLTIIETADPVIISLEDPLRLAIRCLSGFVAKQIASGGSVAASLNNIEHYGAEMSFKVVGGKLTEQEFDEQSKPLTEISSYLNANGASMPMALRTIARVAAICGGEFTYSATSDGYLLTLSLPNMPAAASTGRQSANG